jgi:hypothetical protein
MKAQFAGSAIPRQTGWRNAKPDARARLLVDFHMSLNNTKNETAAKWPDPVKNETSCSLQMGCIFFTMMLFF